ncbi:hypothetical protein INT44_000697 [Umbelopsis vinacea]|uniref:CipC-like antibiotic response protein n=1 Tax=Umbelopsis vinacea TaxID=44442 RepID=A0A8H7Q8G4_9FUNG|nr:hypothetical protein INT44_000697 [Umbelopsis vinacea]KAI9289660.1 hypothetical protein BC943DRAFT_349262 [Umbelopsis sp. AD052]
MGFLDNFQGHHEEVSNASHEHKGHFSHELIAGAASFAAVKAWEDKNKRDGKPANHALAKQMLAGFAGAEIDKLIETKGLNHLDREKAKREAQHNVEKYYEHEHERR